MSEYECYFLKKHWSDEQPGKTKLLLPIRILPLATLAARLPQEYRGGRRETWEEEPWPPA